ncbi:hypothetical protein HG535_0G03980 [Zygotorulaspora mrakii]|uniref:Cleavage and polyadenylation specificity factor subunit 2 n=1 Tax=Zygotorulaspora mrakii TaxID=42260 RepID=A0A7H9B711_ZYGMR|nr:uncharacterized protein HG535_0G03980 [Zygotorulaspora mrakii]QLG74515.1 hypothetical protein HG535_0G03980 [Zygotorulaspora mrakii]
MTCTSRCCDDGSGSAVGTIIRFDNVTILIDPGWNSSKISYQDSVQYWSNIIPEVDTILISQPSAECLGAFALLYFHFLPHFISRIEVYATLPIANLGRISTIDLYVSKGIVGPYDTNEMDLEDIENSFDHITVVKYSQIVDLRSKFDGLTLVAYNAGVSPGGCIWCISTYSEKLVYARRWNHTRDTILNRASLLDNTGKPLSTLMRPSAIITTFDKFGSSMPHVKRIKLFKDTIKGAISGGGSAILPVDIGGNFLDLMVSINDFLYENSKNRLYTQVPVILVSHSKGRSLTYARSMLEWLSSSVIKTWESRDNRSPFDMGRRFHVAMPSELNKYKGSKICFVSQVDILVDEVVTKLCQMDKSTIILNTIDNKDDANTLQKLHTKWETAKRKQELKEGKTISFSESISLKTLKCTPLSGEEMENFTKKISERKMKHHELEVSLKKEAMKTNISLGSLSQNGATISDLRDAEEEDEEDGDTLLNILRNRDEPSSARNKSTEIPVDMYIQADSLSRHKMFPFQPVRIKMDDYGTFVDFNSFLPRENDDEIDLKKRKDIDDNEEDEDPYDLADPRRIPVKRSRKDNKGEKEELRPDTFDNLDYLNWKTNPMKRVESSVTVMLKCSLTCINLECLVDQRSASIIWPALKPRKLLLIGPEESQNQTIAQSLKKRDIDVIDMSLNNDIEFNTPIKSVDISIDPELDQLLKWQRISDGYTVAHVVGRLVREKQKVPNGLDPSQQLLRSKMFLKPLKTTSKVHSGASLSIGDVGLAELKRKLNDQNYRAEFKGEGTLVVNGEVAVRKISDAETIVDGTPSELFYHVKKSVTDMLARI